MAAKSERKVNYVLSAMYTPHEMLASAVLGQTGSFTGINLTRGYDKRLQPTTIVASSTNGTALNLTYNFNLGTADNGDVASIANSLNTARTQA
jgi:hypothetical protein